MNTIKLALCSSIAFYSAVSGQVGYNCTSKSPTALTAQGTVTGLFDASGNSVYLGIPYAATTGGSNRWLPPQDPANYTSFNASSYSATCPQAISGTGYSQQGEDCLSLNIWTPSNSTGQKFSVFVYIYGGAMVTGSSSNAQFQGNNFARKGVVMASFNTRESIFASPHSAELIGASNSQNFGILDVEKAMDWIRNNIQAFGGDPNRIVLGGHSSGAVHVDHYLWNHPSTWLAGAIEMSANAISGPAYAPPNIALNSISASVNCTTGPGQLACLRQVSIYDLETTVFNSSTNTWFCPTIDNITRFSDYVARHNAGLYPSHVPLITGNSAGEGTVFSIVYGSENTNFSSWINTFDADDAHIPDAVLLAAYNASDFASVSLESGDQYGDARFDCAVDYMLDLRSQQQSTWVYRFFGAYDNVVGVAGTAPTHGTEIPFFLGGNECFSALANVTVAEQALADSINDWFVAWIKNPAAGPGWEKAGPRSGPLARLGVAGNETEVIMGSTGDYNEICQSVYNQYYPLYPVVQNPVALAGGS